MKLSREIIYKPEVQLTVLVCVPPCLVLYLNVFRSSSWTSYSASCSGVPGAWLLPGQVVRSLSIATPSLTSPPVRSPQSLVRLYLLIIPEAAGLWAGTPPAPAQDVSQTLWQSRCVAHLVSAANLALSRPAILTLSTLKRGQCLSQAWLKESLFS